MTHEFQKQYKDLGYCVVDSGIKNIEALAELFKNKYKNNFTEDHGFNRNLIKCFANEPSVRKLFLGDIFFDVLHNLDIKHPLFTGPIVTHYTSLDPTGGAYGLKMHQDWPSMATSDNGVICWLSLFNTDESTHGISLVPGSHKNGVLPGIQTDAGYVVEETYTQKKINLEINRGQFLFMHPWLVHATFVNEKCSYAEYKLSISTRLDSFDCEKWAERGYRNAYSVQVDRKMWLSP